MKEEKNISKNLEKKHLKNAKSKSTPIKKNIDFGVWSFGNPIPAISKEKKLRIETSVRAIIHWSADEWKTIKDTPTSENGHGRYVADLVGNKWQGENILFTFYWPDDNRWENKDFEVHVMED